MPIVQGCKYDNDLILWWWRYCYGEVGNECVVEGGGAGCHDQNGAFNACQVLSDILLISNSVPFYTAGIYEDQRRCFILSAWYNLSYLQTVIITGLQSLIYLPDNYG